MRSAMDLHLLPFLLGARSRNDLQHFIGDLLLSASAAVRLVDGHAFCPFFFYFFFYFYCRSHNESGPNPLPPIWKFFRLSAMCELLRWPLKNVRARFEYRKTIAAHEKQVIIQEKAQPCAGLWRKTLRPKRVRFLAIDAPIVDYVCLALYHLTSLGFYQPLCEVSWRKRKEKAR